MKTTTIIGIDLSLKSTGIAVLRKGIETFRVEPEGDTYNERLYDAFLQFSEVFKEVDADIIVIEEPLITRYTETTKKTIQIHGILRTIFGKEKVDIPILWVYPTTLKRLVTGTGNAQKEDIKEQVKAIFNRFFQNDEADAAALAVIGHAVWNEAEWAGEKKYKDIATDEIEDAVLKSFGMSLEWVEKQKRLKAKEYRRKYREMSRKDRQ